MGSVGGMVGKIAQRLVAQCDQIIFQIFGHLQQWRFAQKHKPFGNIYSKFSQILNKALKMSMTFKILPNLVTLSQPVAKI